MKLVVGPFRSHRLANLAQLHPVESMLSFSVSTITDSSVSISITMTIYVTVAVRFETNNGYYPPSRGLKGTTELDNSNSFHFLLNER